MPSASRSVRPSDSAETAAPLPRHVAVVDDDAGSRRALELLLKALGCECEPFESVRAFLHAHAMRRADCIILDFAMPEIDGLTAQKALRQTNYNGPIIFCSGYAEEEIREQALNLGAVQFLRKPVRKPELLQALQAAGRPAR